MKTTLPKDSCLVKSNLVMDYQYWKNETGWNTLLMAEIIPLCILFIEALIGIVCNVIAATTYWQQRSSIWQNPGNIFTVSLIINDLILSGVAIPLLISLKTTNYSKSSFSFESLCLGTRCAFIFSAVASACGNLLLALDRGDITLRPSKRFFRQKQTILALSLVWICSLNSLFVPIWASSLFTSTLNRQKLTLSINNSIANALYNKSNGFDDIVYNATCDLNRCGMTEEYIIQSALQTLLYMLAAVTIIFIYRKILISVKKRDVRRATRNIGSNFGFYSSKKKTKLCINRWCGKGKKKQEANLLEPSTTKATSETIQMIPIHSKIVKESHVNNETDSKTAYFINQTTERQPTIHPGRAHFASVALSVQAFISLKRIVKEKMEMKRKKHRHLRRMTISITLAFIICWTPYHLLSFILAIAGPLPKQITTCELQIFHVSNAQKIIRLEQKTIFLKEPVQAVNVVLLWAIVLVSLSSIVNPFLYSFSRKKIRVELQKLFCNITINPKNENA